MPQKDLRIAYGAAPEQLPLPHGPDLTEQKTSEASGQTAARGFANVARRK
jgi:hypothetical protein